MAIFTLTGEDTLTLFDRTFNDFADGEVSTFTFPNEIVGVKTGKNANTIYAKNETGNNCTAVIRLMRGSSDDQFLRNKVAIQQRDFVSSQLASGQLVKRLGDGSGVVIRDVYNLEGGIITHIPETKTNAEGDTEQGVTVYNITFARATISIQ